jgi:hypothetical protein
MMVGEALKKTEGNENFFFWLGWLVVLLDGEKI